MNYSIFKNELINIIGTSNVKTTTILHTPLLKSIISDAKKDAKENNNGIEVMSNFICERCVKRINLLDIDSDEYEFIKNKFKNTIVSKISNFKYK